MKSLKITQVKHIAGYVLEITFNDGMISIVDFYPFLSTSLHPQIRKYLKLENFLNFNVEYGDLHWNDYELCFPIYDLYCNKITKDDNNFIEAS